MQHEQSWQEQVNAIAAADPFNNGNVDMRVFYVLCDPKDAEISNFLNEAEQSGKAVVIKTKRGNRNKISAEVIYSRSLVKNGLVNNCYFIVEKQPLNIGEMATLWGGVEAVKDGMVSDIRWRYRECTFFETPQVVVFCHAVPKNLRHWISHRAVEIVRCAKDNK